jgi:hypothetical protein
LKKLENYFCDFCDFKCYQKCDWVKHIERPKHKKYTDGNQMEIKKLEKTFFCVCGKKFQTNAGLWKHKKKCIVDTNDDNNNDDTNDNDNIKNH